MREKGFTLIELIIVIAIMGIIMGIAIPSVVNVVEGNREEERVRHEQMIEKALRQYYALEARYPDSLEQLKIEKFGPDLDTNKYEYIYNKDSKEVKVNLKK